MEKTPNYIKSLLMPNAKAPAGRRAWSIDIESVWLPFFTATNTMGDTAIPHDALGAPLRLAYAKDGSVKFSNNGRPVTRIVKELSDSIRLVRENFTANLRNYAHTVATDRKQEYQQQVELARQAGEPIIAHDKDEMDKAIKLQLEQAIKEAEAQAETEPVAEAEKTTPEPKKPKEKELVTA